MHLHTKNDASRSLLSKVRAQTIQTDRQTDRRDRTHYQATLAGDNTGNHTGVLYVYSTRWRHSRKYEAQRGNKSRTQVGQDTLNNYW